MAAATYKVTVRTDQVNDEGKSAVRIRIHKDGMTRYYQTGIYIKHHKDKRKSEWNADHEEGKRNWVTSRHSDHAALNEKIEQDLKRLRKIETDHPAYTSAQIRSSYRHPEETKRTGFIAFAEEYISRKLKMGQYGTGGAYETQLKYFKRFWGKRPDDPWRITPSLVGDLVHFMRTCDTRRGKGVGYDAKTINDSLSVYRSFFRKAILEGWVPPMPNPFDIAPVEEKAKVVVRPNVKQIFSLMHTEGLTPAETQARNLFLMQFFLNGARISEVYTLRWSDVGKTHVQFRPRKRAKAQKSVPRHDGVEWVLAQYPKQGKYIFPYFADGDELLRGRERELLLKRLNTKIANALTRLAVKAKLPHLTSHMQRHTFADYVWEQTGDIRQVQEMIGHASSKTTEVYLSRLGQLSKDALSHSLYAQVNVRETFTKEGAEQEPLKE